MADPGLRHVTPDGPGIRRVRSGKGFRFVTADGVQIRDPKEIARIRAIAIPPAWTDVWICPDEHGHIQAVGRDARGRRQYRYHAAFRARRDRDKFARLIRFGERLPRIRQRVKRDLARPGLPREKVLATVVALLETTRLRVGNDEYARENASFGLSTLRDRHARVSGGRLHLRFRGKGGRTEERTVVDRRLAQIVRRCQELPGQELFQYWDAESGDEPHPIASEDVNAYLREAAGSDEFSAKDVRTWTATVLAYEALRDISAMGSERQSGAEDRQEERRRLDLAVIERTAEAINDTPTVTRSAYIHPAVLALADRSGARAASRGIDPPTVRRRGRAGVGRVVPDRATELAVLALLRAPASGAARQAGATTRSAPARTRISAGVRPASSASKRTGSGRHASIRTRLAR